MNKIQKRDLLGFFCYFLILAAIFCVAVFVYPMCLTSEGYSGEHVAPSLKEIIKSMLLFIPIILSFGVTTYFYYFVLKFKRFNKAVFPCIVIDATVLVCLGGIALCGVAFLWLMFLIIPASFVLFILGIIFGWKLDNKSQKP